MPANQINLSPERDFSNRLCDNNVHEETEWEIQDEGANDVFIML